MKRILTPFKGGAAAVVMAVSATALPTAFAADDAKDVRIAALVPGRPGCLAGAPRAAFDRGLRQAGYDPSVVTQYCYLELADVPGRVRQILDTRPSVLVLWGSAVAARAVKDATATLPFVFVDVPDPVGNGLVKSLASPGGNATGISNIGDELLGKRVELLKEALPHITRIAILANLANPNQLDYSSRTQEAARSLQIEARVFSVETQPQLATAFAAMERDRRQAVVLMSDPWFYSNRAEIVALAASHRIPAIYNSTAYPALGGLLTYAADVLDISERAAAYVGKILKGAKPGDLPVEQPTKFEFVVNAKTAHELGITLSPATMLRATRVIE